MRSYSTTTTMYGSISSPSTPKMEYGIDIYPAERGVPWIVFHRRSTFTP